MPSELLNIISATFISTLKAHAVYKEKHGIMSIRGFLGASFAYTKLYVIAIHFETIRIFIHPSRHICVFHSIFTRNNKNSQGLVTFKI